MVDLSPEKQNLKQRLTDIQWDVTQNSGTERPFTGKYTDHFENGIYNCIVCGDQLFESDTKFKTSCGWPGFFKCKENSIKEITDNSHGMRRVEVRCKKCDAHLGHIFEDGPKPTGMRYCINSASIDFSKQ